MAATPSSPGVLANYRYLTGTNFELGITATPGGGQINAYQLTAQMSVVSAAASAADSVKLPKAVLNPPGDSRPGALGQLIFVTNNTSNAIQVFGSSPDTINGAATGTGISLAAGGQMIAWLVGYTQSSNVGIWEASISSSAGSGTFTTVNTNAFFSSYTDTSTANALVEQNAVNITVAPSGVSLAQIPAIAGNITFTGTGQINSGGWIAGSLSSVTMNSNATNVDTAIGSYSLLSVTVGQISNAFGNKITLSNAGDNIGTYIGSQIDTKASLNLTSITTFYGLKVAPNFGSGTLGAYVGVQSNANFGPITPGGSCYHFYAVGSATPASGVFVSYYSGINGGTSTYHIYNNGTAQSYLGSNVMVGSPTQLAGIGGQKENFQILGTDGPTSALAFHRHDASASAALLRGYKARGTLSSPTVVNNSDSLAAFTAYGYDSANWQQAGSIQFIVDDASVGAGKMGGKLIVNTTLAGGTTNANVFSINNAGVVATLLNSSIPAGGTTGLGITLSSATNFGVFFGSGAPSLSAAKGSLYLRSDGSATNNRAYINTDGATTWTALTTAA